MLLTELKTQPEKDAFVNLAFLVAKSDGCLGYAESELINLYLEEMEMNQNQICLQPKSLNHLCSNFSDRRSKQIVFSNLLSLAFADGYDNEGKKCILDLIQDNLAVSSAEAKNYTDELKMVNGCYYPNYRD